MQILEGGGGGGQTKCIMGQFGVIAHFSEIIELEFGKKMP